MSHKRKVRKPKWHICPFADERCTTCAHAEPHLVVPYPGEQACGGNCEHTDRHTHCVRIRKKGKK